MNKNKIVVAVSLAVLSLALLFCVKVKADYDMLQCPICESTCVYFTGQTQQSWGHLFWVYKCSNQHTFLVKQN